MHVDLVKSYQFEAAHTSAHADGVPRLHGHSYRVEILVSGECDPKLGWLLDYAEIGQRFQETYNALDHRTLEEVDGLADTSLNGIREWILHRLTGKIDRLQDVHVSIVGVPVFTPQTVEPDVPLQLPARLRFGFEAAHALPNLPHDHKCRRMHGHSFTVETAAADTETLAAALEKIYNELDHQCLNEIEGMANPTSEEVSRWVWNRLQSLGQEPAVVVVAETCTARCIYHGK